MLRLILCHVSFCLVVCLNFNAFGIGQSTKKGENAVKHVVMLRQGHGYAYLGRYPGR